MKQVQVSGCIFVQSLVLSPKYYRCEWN